MKDIKTSFKLDRFKIRGDWKKSLRQKLKEINPFDFLLLGIVVLPMWGDL